MESRKLIARVLKLAAAPSLQHSHIDVSLADSSTQALHFIASTFGLEFSAPADLLGDGSIVVETDPSLGGQIYVQIWSRDRRDPVLNTEEREATSVALATAKAASQQLYLWLLAAKERGEIVCHSVSVDFLNGGYMIPDEGNLEEAGLLEIAQPAIEAWQAYQTLRSQADAAQRLRAKALAQVAYEAGLLLGDSTTPEEARLTLERVLQEFDPSEVNSSVSILCEEEIMRLESRKVQAAYRAMDETQRADLLARLASHFGREVYPTNDGEMWYFKGGDGFFLSHRRLGFIQWEHTSFHELGIEL